MSGKSYAGAAFNSLMEEGSKESVVVMLLQAWDEKRELLSALKEIAAAGPTEQPGEEEWNDMDHAHSCGLAEAAHEAAKIARAAIAKLEGRQ